MATYFLIVIVVSTFTLAEQKHAAIPIRSPCRHAAHSWKKAHACSFLSCRNKHKEIAAPFKPTQVVLSATTHPSRILSLHGFTHISVATPTAHHTNFCTASKLNPVFNQTKMTFNYQPCNQNAIFKNIEISCAIEQTQRARHTTTRNYNPCARHTRSNRDTWLRNTGQLELWDTRNTGIGTFRTLAPFKTRIYIYIQFIYIYTLTLQI